VTVATLATFLFKALTSFSLLVKVGQPDSGQLEQNNQLFLAPFFSTATSFALTFDPSLDFQYKLVGCNKLFQDPVWTSFCYAVSWVIITVDLAYIEHLLTLVNLA
jgi:hypothetical protein